jgi:uncharacterized protein YfiM (DUF2279 family)
MAPDAWLGEDKLKHFFTSAFVQGMGYGTLRAAGASHAVALGGATVVTSAAGVGKELWDRGGRGTPSVKDLVWDAAGAGSATVLLVRTARD